MGFKSTVLGLVAAAALSLGLIGPVSAQNTDDTNLIVSLDDTGDFAITFQQSDYDFGSAEITAQVGDTVSGNVVLLYTDTRAHRPEFRVDMVAGDFNSDTPVPYGGQGSVSGAGVYSIDAVNLTLQTNYNPAQTRWTSQGHPYRIGDIGATNQSGGSIGNTPSVSWPGPANTLETARKVAIGYEGAGTILTGQQIGLSLAVPNSLPEDQYVSILTATVVFGSI